MENSHGSTERGQRRASPALVPGRRFKRKIIMLIVTISEEMARYRGGQGQENVFNGPMIDLDLHPLCSTLAAIQTYYLFGLLAQGLLRAVQYWLLALSESGVAWNEHSVFGAVVCLPATLLPLSP